MIRFLRALARVAAALVALVLVVSLVALATMQTSWFRARLSRWMAESSPRFLNGRAIIGGIDGNLFTGIVLRDVVIEIEGSPLLRTPRIDVNYSIRDLMSEAIVLDGVRLEQPVFTIERGERGWNITRLLRPRPPAASPRSFRPVVIDHVVLEKGRILIDGDGRADTPPARLDDVNGALQVAIRPETLDVQIARLAFQSADPPVKLTDMSGLVRRRNERWELSGLTLRTPESGLRVDGAVQQGPGPIVLDIRAESGGLRLPELAWVGRFLAPMRIAPALRLTARGPFDALAVDIDMRSAVGDARGAVVADITGPERGVRGELDLRDMAIDPWIAGATMQAEATGHATFDLRFGGRAGVIEGTYRFAGSEATAFGYDGRNLTVTGRVDDRYVAFDARAEGYGARATADGSLTLGARGAPTTYALKGRLAGMDLRQAPSQLPLPRLATDLSMQYELHGAGSYFESSSIFDPSAVEGAQIGAGALGRFTRDRQGVGFAYDGDIADVDLNRFGRALDVEFLRAPRLAGRFAGRVKTDGRVDTGVPVMLTASGLIRQASLFAGRLDEVTFDGRIAENRLRTTLRGAFSSLDPRLFDIPGLSIDGALTGALDVDVEFPIGQAATNSADSPPATAVPARVGAQPELVHSPELVSSTSFAFAAELRVRGRATLEASSIGGVTLDRAHVRGAWRGRDADIDEFQLAAAGALFTAKGVMGVATDASSALSFTATSVDLTTLGTQLGRPLSGSITLEGRVEGAPGDLLATAAIEGGGLRYGDLAHAGGLRGRLDARIPNLDPSQTQARLNVDGSLLQIRGVEAKGANLDLMWDGRRLTARTRVERQAQRIAITAAFTPDVAARAATIDTLIIGDGPDGWRLADGMEARLGYGPDGLFASNVELRSGASRLRLDGTPTAPEGLRLHAENVELARLAALAELPEVGGVLNADAVARAGGDGLRVDGRLGVMSGLVRGLRFESFSADFNMAARRLTLDAELRQSPAARLIASGSAPLAFFGVGEADPASPIDLRIESDPIDLAVVGALTTALRELTGLLQTSIVVRGTMGSPEVSGTVSATRGAFRVSATGVRYTDFETRLVFQPTELRVEQLSLRDPDGGTLVTSGALAMERTRIVGLDVKAIGRRLSVLDNAFGAVVVDADIGVKGSVDAPTATGEVTVLSGRLDVDAVMRRFGSGPYSTTPIAGSRSAARLPAVPTPAPTPEVEAPPPAPSAPAPPLLRPFFDRLSVDVAVRIPDNFLLRGDDVRAANLPIGLGRVNLTVGGEFRLIKAPERQVTLVGELVTVRGSYDFQGRRFAIQRDGRIRFEGTTPIDPSLDVTAEREISGVLARVKLGATARRPQVTLSSDPPLDEADILSLIVFNRPINDLGTGERQSLAQRAGGIATGFLLTPIAETLGQTLNLDVFEISTSPDSGGSPTITIGDQIGERLFVKFTQQFGARDYSEFVLEYQIARFLRLQTAFAEGSGAANRLFTRRVERIGIDLIFVFSY